MVERSASVRRGLRALLAAAATALAVVVTVSVIDDEPRVDPYLTFITAHLDVLPTTPAVVSSDAKFSRTIAKFTELDGVDSALDACAGPVAVYVGAGHPILVAEHDYCGGSAWMPKIRSNDVVQLTGPGVQPGLYMAETIKYVPRYESKVGDMPDGDVVLQTCVSRTKMVLVGLRFAAPTST
jgi:hypothetical protein